MDSKKIQLLVFLFVCLLAGSRGQQCPRSGEVLKADPNNECRYLYCYNGRGRWGYCPEGRVFNEREQCCVSPNNNNNNNNNRRNSNNNGDDVEFDYHW